jgi:preprotein translocase subunit SecA
MFNTLLKTVFGTKHDRQLKRLRPLVTRINDLGEKLTPLSDAQLRAKTAEFKTKLDNGATLDDLLPEAFAVVRDAARRTMGMRHYDVQMFGGIALHQGMIVEMRTGEGKTLTATSAVYLNALPARGVHVITVNDYLASRDAEWMSQVYGFLGMSTGAIVHGLTAWERQRAYRADITYGTNNEFGFDFLRDNMKETIEKYVQRDLVYAIVDEVDSILIDEARTPLIISGETSKPAELYTSVDKVMPSMRRDLDFVVDEKARNVQLTDAGTDRVEKLLGVKNLYAPENTELLHHVNQALRAHTLYKKDVHYLVEKGEIVIIDEFTGRKMEGRRWSDGLHQAIEAKEGVRILPESQTLATITYQNYFRMYEKLAGMTGTADTEAEEFHKIYAREVFVVPPNRSMVRKDEHDLVFKNERGKFRAVVEDIRRSHERGQPVLVGTASVEKSQVIHTLLEREGIPHNVLNAKNHAREAQIIAQAGRKHAVTVATNMAGRGTDIILGGNAEMMARQHFDPDKQPSEYKRLHDGLKAQCEGEKQEILGLGGLRVVGTERHESRRIDNQLRGRAGRQGDPGSSIFFLSLEDDLMRIFGADRITGLMERLGMEEDVPIEAPLVNRSIENAQQKVEGMHFDTRKNLFEYDNVMNEQRKAIYALRKQILEGRYAPEILDDETRKEQAGKLAPPPEVSGEHTVASLTRLIRDRVETIVDAFVAGQAGQGEGEGSSEGTSEEFPAEGIDARELSHEMYRHFGAVVTLEDVRMDRAAVIQRAADVAARSLIQQRERVHDLAFKIVEDVVQETCPRNVHPDEWDIDALEKTVQDRLRVQVSIRTAPDTQDKLVDLVWEAVVKRLVANERAFGLPTMLFHVRRIYLREIDEQWIAHLKNIEHLRTGIGLMSYATRNPKNEYKIRGYNLFRDMWESIERTVLDQVLRMQLSEDDVRRAEQGAEYETVLTRHIQRREAANQGKSAAASRGESVAKLQAAASRAMARLAEAGLGPEGAVAATTSPDLQRGAAAAEAMARSLAQASAARAAVASSEPAAPARAAGPAADPRFAKAGRNDPCPCGSGKRFKDCHGKPSAA